MELFLLPPVCHKVLHNLPVHQRLASEEIHLKISPAAGTADQKIQRLLPRLKIHKRTPPVILAFLGKAVSACKVTVVGNMKAQSLHHRFPLLHSPDQRSICIRREELSICRKLYHILQRILKLFFCIPRAQRINKHPQRLRLLQCLHTVILILFIQLLGHIVTQLVHHMHRAAVNIKNNPIPVILVLMNQCPYPFLSQYCIFFI